MTKDERIAELEKEVERLNTLASGFERNFVYELNEHKKLVEEQKTIRHEICEKIRNKLKKCVTPACGTYIVYYEAKNVEDVLDQIEKGGE